MNGFPLIGLPMNGLECVENEFRVCSDWSSGSVKVAIRVGLSGSELGRPVPPKVYMFNVPAPYTVVTRKARLDKNVKSHAL